MTQFGGPRDPILPSEAVHLMADVPTDDPWSPSAYQFEDGRPTGPVLAAARERLFNWLNANELVGYARLGDGRWERVPIEWVRGHRKVRRGWLRPNDESSPGAESPDYAGPLVETLTFDIEAFEDSLRSISDPRLEGAPWFVDRGTMLALLAKKIGRPTYEDVQAWCTRWIRKGRGAGMDAAWSAFKLDPRHAGCNRDDVFRPAWNLAKSEHANCTRSARDKTR